MILRAPEPATRQEETLDDLYLSATAALEHGQVETARRGFQYLVQEAPRFAPAWDGLGSCYAAAGELTQAGECFKKSMRLDRSGWRSRFNWGVELHRAGDLREACKWLRGAAKLAPNERRVHHWLGASLLDQGDWDGALRSFRRALETPERYISDAELWAQIGKAECGRGDFEAADKAYERACLFAPDNAGILADWAVATARAGDGDGALRLAIRARALDPRSTRTLLLVVELALDQCAWDQAESHIRDLDADPEMARLQTALRAELERRRGHADAARKLALRTLSMDGPPSDLAVDYALATVRRLDAIETECEGFRMLVEVICGEESYFRPYVVLAESQEQARWFVAQIQDALDPHPWRLVETAEFDHRGMSQAGVYQMLLTRVLFPRDPDASPSPVHG